MTIHIHHDDFFDISNVLTPKQYKFIFLDPPYYINAGSNLIRPEGKKFEGISNEEWDKFEDSNEYEKFTIAWLEIVEELLAEGGSTVVCGSYQRLFTIGYIMQKRGWYFLNDIIWIKPNPTPNFRGVRFTNGHETLLWAIHNQDKNYTFNYQEIKQFNGGKQMRTEWTIAPPLGNNRLKDKNGKTLHRSQKPEELLYRLILATTNEGDWILDPFAGTGTTGAVANKLGRNCVLIEKEEEYYKAMASRFFEDSIYD